MLTCEDLKEVAEWIKRRDDALYGWLRYLVGLAAGALTVLVSLETGTRTGIAEVMNRVALVSLALGILLGSLRLSAEVWIAKRMAKRLAEQKIQQSASTERVDRPFSISPPPFPFVCEIGCYLCLFVALVALVLMAWTGTPAK